MTELDYAHYSLNDVPNEVFAFERTLEKIVLDCNNIRDLPRQLFHCEGLRHLSVADNDVHVIPPALASLASLRYLNVSKNVLTDIPDSIKQCKQLESLDASVNPLQKIPEGCTQLLSITELYLNDTFLEFLPANFGRLSQLKILELRENGLNSLPKSLNRLVNLERLDLGQNDISEVPEVIGSLCQLKELWLDGNKIKSLPPIMGHLSQLHHLEASLNRINYVSEAIQHCRLLTDLGLSTNDLKSLPEAIGGLESLVTLKLDDNQLNELPLSIGKLRNLEELVVSQNYLEHLPPSIGLCRKLHTLNLDDNDLEVLPKEIGSCRSLRILSVHANRLTTLPAEIDHISNLAVINLTANMIQHLPVSLMKLNNVSAIWLSENQHKPLVQLNQDTDPETGQRVLTNFLLPQQNQEDLHYDNKSESGSFHALAWEEERSRRSQVKWAGDYQVPDALPPSQSSLRREPTPFPKEMRAMAKRVQNLRNKKVSDTPADDLQQKKKRRVSLEITNPELINALEKEANELSVSDVPSMEVKEAKVLNMPHEVGPPPSEDKELEHFEEMEKAMMASNESPDKTSRDSGVSDGSLPDQEVNHNVTASQTGNGNSRHPCDPLPQAPVKAEVVTNELDQQPPPYHIAAQMSRHPNGFQTLERKSSFTSDATMESISGSVSGSETSTAPSSLQTIVRAPASTPLMASMLASKGNGMPKMNNNNITDANNSETESVYNHANNLRKVSEKMLLQGSGSNGGSGSGSNIGSGSVRNRSSLTSIPRLNNKALINNIAGSEMRPSSYAGPHHTIGLPVLSPSSRLNQTLPTPSATSTLERPSKTRPLPPPSNIPLRKPSLETNIPQLQALQKSPPPAIPILNLRPKNNGLLTTIEQAAMSDEEPGSPGPMEDSFPSGMSRIPTPLLVSNNQPNYENVAAGRRMESPSSGSLIPVVKKNSLPKDRLSTANFVASSPPRKGSGNELVKRGLATPSPKPPVPSSKIPIMGNQSK